ncbi:MAG TPA: hypothetical protein VD886_04940 [Herpetosiphonaceae bacterium]|nr:hypothetical protein [Herpetosiphonaceae bacterium]
MGLLRWAATIFSLIYLPAVPAEVLVLIVSIIIVVDRAGVAGDADEEARPVQ